VLIAWGRKDVAAAFAQYQALGLNDSALLSKLLAGSAAKNPMQVLGYLQQLDASQFGRCAPQIVESWARSDPAAALAWALANGVRISMQSGAFSGDSVKPLAEAFQIKPQETMAWLNSLPPGTERDRMMELAIGSCSDTDTELQLFEKLPAEAAARAARRMGIRFHRAPERARDWAMSLPSGPIRMAALESVGEVLGVDIELPPGPDRDAFLSGTVHRPVSGDTVQLMTEKFATIEQIGDPVLRRDLFDETMEEYAARRNFSTTETRAAFESAKMPEEWKRRWREVMSKAK
jgi:hypothetical protein